MRSMLLDTADGDNEHRTVFLAYFSYFRVRSSRPVDT